MKQLEAYLAESLPEPQQLRGDLCARRIDRAAFLTFNAINRHIELTALLLNTGRHVHTMAEGAILMGIHP